MAGGHRLSCTSLSIQDHGLPVGASCRPIEPAWLQCCQTNLSALNKRTASSPPALLLRSSFWERSCVQAMHWEGSWEGRGTLMSPAGELSCSHSSMCSCLLWRGWSSSLYTWLLLFGHIFLLGLGFCFLLFFFSLKGGKKEKYKFARYMEYLACGGWRWFLYDEKSFVWQIADCHAIGLMKTLYFQ